MVCVKKLIHFFLRMYVFFLKIYIWLKNAQGGMGRPQIIIWLP